MLNQTEWVKPDEIEKRSLEIIQEELGQRVLDEKQAPVIKRVIHATADFDYADNLIFSDYVVDTALRIFIAGANIVSDTQMIRSGINRNALSKLNCSTFCFMSDPDIAELARKLGVTRAALSVDKAARTVENPLVYVVGNAPTALIRLDELIKQGEIKPDLIIGVPVGFVNVIESKELIMKAGIPTIISRGRKGGSTVAAAIVNALLYMAGGRDEK